MFKKVFLLLFLSLIISGCGYMAVYKGVVKFNYKILVSEHSGDRDMINLINTRLKKYSKIKSDKSFIIKIDTIYRKNIIAKDAAGKATDYQIKVTSNFGIKSEVVNKIIKINETFNVKGMDDKFEEQRYDTIIKNNIANAIVKKIILQLSRN